MEIKASYSQKNKNLYFKLVGGMRKNPFLPLLLDVAYYIFLWFLSVLGAKLKTARKRSEKEENPKSSSKPFASCWRFCWRKKKWSEGSYKDVVFRFLSNQCVAWYMSDIIAFKNIIFSLKMKWMSVKQTCVCWKSLVKLY